MAWLSPSSWTAQQPELLRVYGCNKVKHERRPCLSALAYLDIILLREIWFCALKEHSEGIHQGMKSNFVRGNLMPTPLYNDWRKLIITNNIPVSAIQELFNRIFIIHVSWYTSTSPFCNISEINSISSCCSCHPACQASNSSCKQIFLANKWQETAPRRPRQQNWCLQPG